MATIREKGYHHWDGQLLERRRPWWPITRMGIDLTFRKKRFKFLFALSFGPAFFFLVGVYISERIDDFRFMIKGSENFLRVNPGYFKTYFTIDVLLFMLVMLLVFAGAGLIADDLKFNSLQLYFSRPLRKRDYLLGKAAVVFFFVLLLTLVPGLILFVMKLVFAGSFRFFLDYPWLPLSIIGYSLLLTFFFAAYSLFLSALSKNRRYVMIMMFAVYIFSDVLYGILFSIFHNPYCALFSIKNNLQQTGAVLFGQRPPYGFPPILSFLFILAVGLASFALLLRRVRGVEVVK